ncbi:MAG: LD-carboxypeptidase [Paenibacillaceae bacterium]|nr:LD-carboxypeptidase [Paenibacillaceae bacterium]
MTIKPGILRSGDTIGVVTLGSPLAPTTIQARIDTMQRLGFRVVVGNYAYDAQGLVAASAQARAADLMGMFHDSDVRLILPTRGGTGVIDILPYLDYAYISAHPKIVSGYSDISVLLNTLYSYSDLMTLHSLMLIDFKMETPAYNFNQFFTAASTLDSPRTIVNPPAMAPPVGLVPGDVTAPVVGGNMTSLVGSLGTAYEWITDGKIVFLEETHEPINRVYRYLTQLLLAGKFRRCAGIVMGQCTDCAVAYGQSYDDLIRDLLVPLGVPLLTGVATGHGIYKAAIPIGAMARLNATASTFTLLEPSVTV